MISLTPLFAAAAVVVASQPTPSPSPVGTSAPSVASAPKLAFDRADAELAVKQLAVELEEGFLFPDKGKAYATMLRAKLAEGAYADFPDAPTFAAKVTADLQAVHKDGHLRVRIATARPSNDGPPRASAIAKAGWLADGVAYVDFRGFPGDPGTLAEVRKFLAAHGSAKTLIIDARHNGGGGLAEMNLLFAQIFAEPTRLVTMDIRQAIEEKRGSPFEDDDRSIRKVDGPPTIVRREHLAVPAADQSALRKAKVILLTSKKTFSAAEHLALALKRTGRATLIGEATGGGAHFGGMAPIGKTYAVFLPAGRTFDPDTGESWEGTGVKPDIAVAADQALDRALQLAGAKTDGKAALAAIK